MTRTAGLDQYSASLRTVDISQHHHHVFLSVEATSGSATGEALLTPGQARTIADALIRYADAAEVFSASQAGEPS